MKSEKKFAIAKEKHLVFPSDYSKSGRLKFPHKNITITILLVHTNILSTPLIVTSDLHHRTLEIFEQLDTSIDLSKHVVITAGDVAGKSKDGRGIRGSDGDPLEAYRFIIDRSKEFYFVQGNHDLPSNNYQELKLFNNNGNQCSLHNRVVTSYGVGRITGIDGTISNKRHPYKFPEEEYLEFVERQLKKRVNILVTHETPAIRDPNNPEKYFIGNQRLFELTTRYRPLIHIYGHCYHPTPINNQSGTFFMNVDSRILIIQYPDHF